VTGGPGTVRIGNGQGFWGDSVRGPLQLVRDGRLDYLTMDYLAEVTMSILQKMRARDAGQGYATDVVAQLERILVSCLDQGVKVVANAGGINPGACATALADVARRLGVDVRIATVSGDDLLPRLPHLLTQGHDFHNLDTGELLAPHLDRVRSANAYLGAFPIAQALDEGADVVITGRVTDASLTIGPLVHAFGWKPDDLDLLAAGTVAGHIIECGTQATGGNYDRWRDVPDLARIGFPVVEFAPSGDFVVTKPDGTGGLVDVGTVTAQLVYEIGDPARYLGPDVVTDFTGIRLDQVGRDRVRVTGARGRAATESYKVSLSTHEGWRIVSQLTVGGPDAVEKARLTADILFARLAEDGVTYPARDIGVDVLGAGALYPGMPPTAGTAGREPDEVVLRVAVRSPDRRALDRLGREVASLLTSGPPGLTGFAGGRPRAGEVVGFWPALVDKSAVTAVVEVPEAGG
jgi:Acyclic terpene utilisation family protein AtuA